MKYSSVQKNGRYGPPPELINWLVYLRYENIIIVRREKKIIEKIQK